MSLSDWLRLREPADVAARSDALAQWAAAALPRDRAITAIDLGTGSGANIRYLAPRLPSDQRWLAVDNDRALLAEIPARVAAWTEGTAARVRVETRQMTLGGGDHPELFADRDFVTASALLDLVSTSWLEWLASQCAAAGAVVLFALTYNGRASCTPAEPEDGHICDLLNRHQKISDKGFGRAAGPDAAAFAEWLFTTYGYRVRSEPSDWILTPEMGDLQRQLIQGWADAAFAMAAHAPMVHDWLARRLAHVDGGRSRIVVGHTDLAATFGTP